MSLAITDLSIVNNEPRMLDLRLAEALGFGQSRDIRKLVDRNVSELESHGRVCATVAQTSGKGGRPTSEYWLNEAQALLIAMFSRTEKAAEVRHQIIQVFMAWRKQEQPKPASTAIFTPAENEPLQAQRVRLDMVREVRALFGVARARAMWSNLGLPVVPAVTLASPELEEPKAALAMILDEDMNNGQSIRSELLLSLEGDQRAETAINRIGLRSMADEEGFLIACNHSYIQSCFSHTSLAGGRWRRLLRTLPGARAHHVMRFNGENHRTIFIPAGVLDD
jgi:hypothetical protein